MSSNKFKYLPAKAKKDEEEKSKEIDAKSTEHSINYLSRPDLSSTSGKEEEEYVLSMMNSGPPVIPGMEPYMPQTESLSTRMLNEFKKNPFIPIGMGAVVFCLGRGIYLLGRNTALSDQYMSYRIYSSLFLIGAIVGGEFYHTKIKGESSK